MPHCPTSCCNTRPQKSEATSSVLRPCMAPAAPAGVYHGGFIFSAYQFVSFSPGEQQYRKHLLLTSLQVPQPALLPCFSCGAGPGGGGGRGRYVWDHRASVSPDHRSLAFATCRSAPLASVRWWWDCSEKKGSLGEAVEAARDRTRCGAFRGGEGILPSLRDYAHARTHPARRG